MLWIEEADDELDSDLFDVFNRNLRVEESKGIEFSHDQSDHEDW